MKKAMLLGLIFGVVIGLSAQTHAQNVSLQWQYPTDWANIDGYIVYANEVGQTDTPYNDTILKSDLAQDGVNVTYSEMPSKLSLAYGQAYSIWITAYNAVGQSGPSNVVEYTRPLWSPPPDNLAQGVTIVIPNAPVTVIVK